MSTACAVQKPNETLQDLLTRYLHLQHQRVQEGLEPWYGEGHEIGDLAREIVRRMPDLGGNLSVRRALDSFTTWYVVARCRGLEMARLCERQFLAAVEQLAL
jgi:hypothetical protein